MLVQFTVENFLSFDEETSLSMVASSDQQHPSHVADYSSPTVSRILRGAAIYGANAAGKSNLIQAIGWAQRRILRGTRPGQTIPVKPFRLRESNGKERPSRFQFTILAGETLYEYGFSADHDHIHEEWLFGTPARKGAKEKLYFERTTRQAKTKVTPGPGLVGRSEPKRQRMEFLAEGTRPNQLFLTELVERNVKEIEPVRTWFESTLLVLSAEAQNHTLAYGVYADEKFRRFFMGALQAAGAGITSIRTEEEALELERHFPSMPNVRMEELQEKIAALKDNTFVTVAGPFGESQIILRKDRNEPVVVSLRMEHCGDRQVEFELEEESEGTQRLMHLLPALYTVCAGREQVLLLDELDRRLHPLLSRLLVETALSALDGSSSQLVFTTHDTNLLDLDLLRRDEIWFVEKDGGGASHLYSLAEFKIRPDLKVEKGYLNGRFGAIPFAANLQDLGWLAARDSANADGAVAAASSCDES